MIGLFPFSSTLPHSSSHERVTAADLVCESPTRSAHLPSPSDPRLFFERDVNQEDLSSCSTHLDHPFHLGNPTQCSSFPSSASLKSLHHHFASPFGSQNCPILSTHIIYSPQVPTPSLLSSAARVPLTCPSIADLLLRTFLVGRIPAVHSPSHSRSSATLPPHPPSSWSGTLGAIWHVARKNAFFGEVPSAIRGRYEDEIFWEGVRGSKTDMRMGRFGHVFLDKNGGLQRRPVFVRRILGTRNTSDSEVHSSSSESSDELDVDAPACIHTAVAQRAPTPPLRCHAPL